MRFTLYSHDTPVGHTALDIPCVESTLRQGFLDPIDGADPILAAATGVPSVLAAALRARRDNGGATDATLDATFDAAVQAALRARETLELCLRDEQGTPVECDFIRLHDLRDPAIADNDLIDDPESEVGTEWEFNEAMRDDDDPSESALEDSSETPAVPIDERWETKEYLLQVFLPHPEWRGRPTGARP